MRRALPLLLVLGACGPRAVVLVPDNVVHFHLGAAEASGQICANDARPQVRGVVVLDDGTQLSTAEDDRRSWVRDGEIAWKTDLGSISAEGALTLPPDRRSWFGKKVTVSAVLRKRPDLHDHITLEPVYACGRVDLRGDAGGDGYASSTGGAGDAAPPVDVALSYVELPQRMVLAEVRVQGRELGPFLLDPAAPGRFVIDARGGRGGHGGKGSDGLDGRDGSDGSSGWDGSEGPPCSSGSDGGNGEDGRNGGSGSNGGDGGDGGDGATVTVRHDARSPELARMLQIDVAGGDGGHGGQGGDGGHGGDGGKGGAGGKDGCSGYPNADGHGGSRGQDGFDGSPGRAGRAGRAGQVVMRPIEAP